MLIKIKGGTSKSGLKRSTAQDAHDLVQEAQEKLRAGKPISDERYLRRMNRICRGTGSNCKNDELLKARMEDFEYRKERGM